MKNQYDLPLPQASLHKRFLPLFETFQKGQSTTLIGAPYCGKGSFLRTMIETNKEFTTKLSGNYDLHFVFIDAYFEETDEEKYKKYIFRQLAHTINKAKDIKLDDLNDEITVIENFIRNLRDNEKIIIVLFGIEGYVKKFPTITNVLKMLYHNTRNINNTPTPKLSFLFISTPMFFKIPQLFDIQSITHQNIFYFDRLNNDELDYIRKRFEANGIFSIDDSSHNNISKISGGHYYIYKTIAKNYAEGMVNLDLNEIKNNPQINTALNKIYQSLLNFSGSDLAILNEPLFEKIGLTQNHQFISPLFSINPVNVLNQQELTAQELLVYEFLLENFRKIITKEKLAKKIWGNTWVDNYSEQALDKLISRLRKKLDKSFRLTVIRNKGIRLSPT